MKKFMDNDFLLSTSTASYLYHNFAKKMPIFDFHCHLSPKEIYEDKTYLNITQVWLYGDHYKWRLMRSFGIDEKYITGDAEDYDKFMAYAKCIQYAIGNPLYHWSHLELRRFFGVEDILTESTAPKIWETVNSKIRSRDFSARKLIEKSNVRLIATTDDPADTLIYHKKIYEDNSFNVRVIPTFRPDNVINIEKNTFKNYIEKLSSAVGYEISTFDLLKTALCERLDYFASFGCKISDHSFMYIPFEIADDAEVNTIFKSALENNKLDKLMRDKYKTALMLFLGEQYRTRNCVMQLHISPLRNNNTKMFCKLGADTGFDSIYDGEIAVNLSKFLDTLNNKDMLPKAILYSLNPMHNYTLGTMLGNFQEGGIKSKIQLGSAWWFNDNKDGIREHIKALANLGCLSGFVGMLTDSRSFLSYPRHEYFRRILCDVIGSMVENGEFSDDIGVLKTIVEDICYKNAEKYFNIEGV